MKEICHEKESTMRRRRDRIGAAHLAVTLGILIGVVYGAYHLLGLPAWLAVVAGAPVGYVVSRNVVRRLLPPLPALTDQERIRMTSPRRWLALDIFTVVLLHFGGGLSWALSLGVAVVTTLVFFAIEWRNRNQTRLRLKSAESDS